MCHDHHGEQEQRTRTKLDKKIPAVHVFILLLSFYYGPCVVSVCSVLQQEISHLFVLLCDKTLHQNAAVNSNLFNRKKKRERQRGESEGPEANKNRAREINTVSDEPNSSPQGG